PRPLAARSLDVRLARGTAAVDDLVEVAREPVEARAPQRAPRLPGAQRRTQRQRPRTAEPQQAGAEAETERDLEIPAPLRLVGKALELGRILAPAAGTTPDAKGLDLGSTLGEADCQQRRKREHDRADERPQD